MIGSQMNCQHYEHFHAGFCYLVLLFGSLFIWVFFKFNILCQLKSQSNGSTENKMIFKNSLNCKHYRISQSDNDKNGFAFVSHTIFLSYWDIF